MEPTGIQSVKKGDTGNHSMQMVDGRTRLKAVIVCADSHNDNSTKITLYNGTDDTYPEGLEWNVSFYSVYGGSQLMQIPGNGILFDSGIFLSKEYSVTGVVSVTALFQGGKAAS